MGKESFENPDVGKLLNDHFMSIKVDREERPDVDKMYMTFAQRRWLANEFVADARPVHRAYRWRHILPTGRQPVWSGLVFRLS